MEERLLHDGDFFELLQAEEDELMDEYIADELSPADRQQFEQTFLAAPERRTRLRWAQALHQQLAKEAAAREPVAPQNQATFTLAPSPPIPWWRAWLSSPLTYAAAFVLLAAVGWGIWHTSSATTPPLASFTLLPFATRGGAAGNFIAVPSGATQIQLILELEQVESGAYQAVLRDELGKEQRWDGLRLLKQGQQQQLVLTVPTAQLPAGAYQINLMATAGSIRAEQYTFQVTR
ncbi:MAG: hypothetical protein HYR56_11265 [Acidobacteria bacterium]|nr:hypothetical protein [Acidobacteriota bacterium]MBI3422151.1 hypothetical protein [Acidobacteriota bacterium]